MANIIRDILVDIENPQGLGKGQAIGLALVLNFSPKARVDAGLQGYRKAIILRQEAIQDLKQACFNERRLAGCSHLGQGR